jgi:hypothetical protein
MADALTMLEHIGRIENTKVDHPQNNYIWLFCVLLYDDQFYLCSPN